MAVRHGAELRASWQRPLEGVIKLNFDASFRSGEVGRSGLVARDSEELVLAATTMFPVMAPLTMMAEALEFRWVITLASAR